tara:strand:+ start:8092 stop:8391 length:300 start_codon:yes stop_codon:yes gene_type:complete
MRNANVWSDFGQEEESPSLNKSQQKNTSNKQQYDNSNSGVLYKSDYDSSDFYGNYTPGNCIHCNQPQEKVDILAWTNTARDSDKKYISIKKKRPKGNPS